MKKLFFIIAVLLIISVWFTACSSDEKLSITVFIDEHIDQYTNNLPVYGHYGLNGLKHFVLTEEQWQVVRSLFDETNWTELEDYEDTLPPRSVETGFMSFNSEYETIAFLIPERIVYTLETISDEVGQTVKNRYFTIDKETVELLDSQVADFAAAYEPPQSEKGG